MKKTLSILLLVATIFLQNSGFAQSQDQRKQQYNLGKAGLAIEGYDPVAYFVSGKAVQGSNKFATSYQGVLYYFSSQQNKDLFKSNPDKYEPQYGGWCAYAMGATGEKVEVDPETFKITDGKLYLFYHSWTNNTLLKWNKDEKSLKSKADVSWKVFIK
ncbi:MAG: YHS domain-containing protein [Chitinophagaceae bacterium]|nr:YHS domain-containing protein [Chitinophagaceae bacterium]